MHISFKPILRDKEKAYVDRFEIRHDRHVAHHKKEMKIEKKNMLHDRQEKIMLEISLEKKEMKENNLRWRQLNIIS